VDNRTEVFADDNVTGVVLEGGPTDFPTTLPIQRITVDGERIRVQHRGGYEHFECVDISPEGPRPRVFRWTMRTQIAE
jgi:hypothetical protein